MRLIYLAHPVAACPRHTTREHAELAAVYLRACRRALSGCDADVIAPWLGELWAYGMAETSDLRRRALEISREIVPRCDAILLCGHVRSAGMEEEWRAGVRTPRWLIGMDYVGLPPQDVAERVRAAMLSTASQPACQEGL